MASSEIQQATQQVGQGAATIGYYLQYAIAPALLAGLPWVKSKLNQFIEDFHIFAVAMKELADRAIGEKPDGGK